MKLFSNISIEKGMLPLLDISMMFFGIMIIILTYARFEEVAVRTEQENNPVALGISLAMGEDISNYTKMEDSELSSHPVTIVENLVKRATLEGRLIMLRFNVNGVIKYKGNVFFENGKFDQQTLDMVIESIEKNDPMIIIGYPDTKGYNKATKGVVTKVKEEMEKYTDAIFLTGIKVD